MDDKDQYGSRVAKVNTRSSMPAADASVESGWEPELEELKERRRIGSEMGGAAAVERQHKLGKLSARERINILVDPGSFREMGVLAGKARYDPNEKLKEFVPANAIIGTGAIDARKVSVSADDFTIRGGSSESAIADKWIYAERLAFEMKMPLVRLVDTAGGSVKLLDQQQSTKIPGYPTWSVVPLGSAPAVVDDRMRCEQTNRLAREQLR